MNDSIPVSSNTFHVFMEGLYPEDRYYIGEFPNVFKAFKAVESIPFLFAVMRETSDANSPLVARAFYEITHVSDDERMIDTGWRFVDERKPPYVALHKRQRKLSTIKTKGFEGVSLTGLYVTTGQFMESGWVDIE